MNHVQQTRRTTDRVGLSRFNCTSETTGVATDRDFVRKQEEFNWKGLIMLSDLVSGILNSLLGVPGNLITDVYVSNTRIPDSSTRLFIDPGIPCVLEPATSSDRYVLQELTLLRNSRRIVPVVFLHLPFFPSFLTTN